MAYRSVEPTEADERLKALLVGHSIQAFETGDVWVLLLHEPDLKICFLGMTVPESSEIQEALKAAVPGMMPVEDPYVVAWSVVLASVSQRTILDVTVDLRGAMSLRFEGGLEFTLLSDNDFVDWQWCVTANHPNPYRSKAQIVCFAEGDLMVDGRL